MQDLAVTMGNPQRLRAILKEGSKMTCLSAGSANDAAGVNLEATLVYMRGNGPWVMSFQGRRIPFRVLDDAIRYAEKACYTPWGNAYWIAD